MEKSRIICYTLFRNILFYRKECDHMSAIAGILDLKISEEVVENMLLSMSIRGKYGHSSYLSKGKILLHTSSIYENNLMEQPIILDWAGERYIISFDGFLYNKKELIRLLEEQKKFENFKQEFSAEMLQEFEKAFAEYLSRKRSENYESFVGDKIKLVISLAVNKDIPAGAQIGILCRDERGNNIFTTN